MYSLFFLCALYVCVKGEPCVSPSGQSGTCVPIRSCPSLVEPLANVNYKTEKNLQQFVCSNGELGLIVCCVTTDYLVFEDDNTNTTYDIYDLELKNAEDCGLSSNSANDNGVNSLQDFPWLVKIMFKVNPGKEDEVIRMGCTGVIINKWYVLYSAQCHYSNLIITGDFYVQIDSYRSKDISCSSSSHSSNCSYFENYQAQYQAHPFYDYLTNLNDVAILRLNRRIYNSEYLRPICLPIDIQPVKVGQTLQTSGWKRTYSKSDITIKQSQSSIVIPNAECQRRLVESGNNISITTQELCTYTEKHIFNKNVIGLPLMSLRGDKWYLEGFETQGKSVKVYTRVQSYLEWIRKGMGGERCLTPYNETGEGVYLSECPKLMDAFANTHPTNEKELIKFAGVWNSESDTDKNYILKVCCGISPNFTIPPKPVDKNLDRPVSDYRFCGLQHRDDYISSNDEISVDEFPWLAIIMRATFLKQRDSVCGGTLITNRYVLTSGRCIRQFYWFDSMLVRLGDLNFRNASDCVKFEELDAIDCNDIQEYGVEKKIVHPFYNKATFVNDIALLRLKKRVSFSDYVRPICLPRSEEDLPQYGDTLFSTGFGDLNKSYGGLKIKKKVRSSLISSEECKEKINSFNTVLPITPYHICAEDFKNSTDVICVGDEGGPIMFSKRSQWFLIGISSNYACGGNKPQTNLNVYKYLRWIMLNIEK